MNSNKNLYKIKVRHTKGNGNCYEDTIQDYVIADSEEEVLKHIDKEYANGWWLGELAPIDIPELETEEGEWLEFSTYKDYLMAAKGDWSNVELYEDPYYGNTLYAWELVKENIDIAEINALCTLKVAKEI